MSDKLLLCTVGLPRSRKSTWARKMSHDKGIPIVNLDSIRLALHGQAFIQSAEPTVWATAKLMVAALFLASHDVVILDATNTTHKRRDEWKDPRWKTAFHVFPATKDECVQQAKEDGREDLIPVIERMAAAWEPLGEDEVGTIPLGATGEFPDGECSADDEGELRIAIAADRAARLVRVDFGKEVSWLALPPKQALALSESLRLKARQCKGD